MLVPLALYLVIAVGSRTLQVEDFFASGRRVPPVYNGFVLAAVAVGGVGFLVLHRHGVLSRLRRAGDRARLDLRHVRRRRPVRALSAQSRLLHAAELSRPPLPLARLAHGGKRDAAPAHRAASRRRDQDRRADRLVVPADLVLLRRDPGGGADRRHRHSRRHALGDLGGQRGVSRRRGRPGGGGHHRVDPPHQSAGAATDLWRDLLRLAQCRDHRRSHPGAAWRARHRAAGIDAAADHQAVPAALRHSRPDGLRDAVSLSCARHGGPAEPAVAERRDQLDRRSAPLDRLGPLVRRPVRDDGAGHGRLCQAHHLPRHRPGAGVVPAGLAHRAERTSICSRPPTSMATARSGRPSCSSPATASRWRCRRRRGCLTC